MELKKQKLIQSNQHFQIKLILIITIGMKIYFVRHGVTDAIKKNVYQPDDEPLSPEGRRQAQTLGKRFKSIETDIIYTSPITRALETAKIIQNHTKKEVVSLQPLSENKPPSEIKGQSRTDPKIKKIIQKLKNAGDDPYWRYADEEKHFEIVARAKETLLSLESSGYQNIIAVSHAHFIKILIANILHSPSLTCSQFIPFFENLALHNTGITVIEKTDGPWRVITINDKLHFGEYSSGSEWPH